MSFIKTVRIRNFRSIRDAEFDVGNLNIFVGQNDAGKSNILRALNLFFNGDTDYGQPFRFDFDYSKSAVAGKGKAQEVAIDLIMLPPPKRFSNAEPILWRKRWRRDGTRHDEPIFVKGGREIGPRSNIVNWLDKLIFRYVPAVKGEEYFSKLMGELHDVLRAITTQYIILTEDIKYNETRALETLLLASGYRKNDFQIMAYNGAGNINAALGLATALKARHPQVEILIHRDRDYLSDEKAKAIEADIRKVGAHPFISVGVDIESHFLDIKHLNELCGGAISEPALSAMLDEATQECEADSIERLLTTWFLQNKQDIGKVGSKVTELTALYRRNVVRYRYSKKVAGVLSAKLQKALKNNTPVVAATESVSSPILKRYLKQKVT